ncbi:MAG: hypothetical protein ABI790_02315 [Betaproteobacteria bacterium]
MHSLKDLDVTKLADVPYRFEITDDVTGRGVGIFLHVIGGHSQKILDFVKEHENEQRVAEEMAKKRDPRNKQVHVRKFEDDIRYSNELVAIRVTEWEGIEEPCTLENAIQLCQINPPYKEQILGKSEDMRNFMRPFTTKPGSTSDTLPG